MGPLEIIIRIHISATEYVRVFICGIAHMFIGCGERDAQNHPTSLRPGPIGTQQEDLATNKVASAKWELSTGSSG